MMTTSITHGKIHTRQDFSTAGLHMFRNQKLKKCWNKQTETETKTNIWWHSDEWMEQWTVELNSHVPNWAKWVMGAVRLVPSLVLLMTLLQAKLRLVLPWTPGFGHLRFQILIN